MDRRNFKTDDDHEQAFVDWALGIQDEIQREQSIREHLRQGHKIEQTDERTE